VRNNPNVIEPEKAKTSSNRRYIEIASVNWPIVVSASHVATGTTNFPKFTAWKFDDVVFDTPPPIVNLCPDSPFLAKLPCQETANKMADIGKNKHFKDFESNWQLLEFQDFHDFLLCRFQRRLDFNVYSSIKR